jgi:hypothetical protein
MDALIKLIKGWFKGRELRPTTTLAEYPGVLFMVAPDHPSWTTSVDCKIEDAEVGFDVVVLDPARKQDVLKRVLAWAQEDRP